MGWIILVVVLLLVPVGVWFAVAWFSTHPVRSPLFLSPYDFGVAFENVQFPSRDGINLRGWWLPNAGAKGVVVVCHGYLSNRCEVLGVTATLHRAGFAVLTFDFRAHGRSGGKLCTLGAKEIRDVQGALDWLDQHAPGLPVAIFGSSLGGATAILAAAQDQRLQAIATDCAFSDLQEAGGDWWVSAGGPVLGALLRPANRLASWMARTKMSESSPYQVIAQISPRPLLIMHAEGDGLVGVRHAHALFGAAIEEKTLKLFPGSNHVQARSDYPEDYYAALLPFFARWEARL